MSRLPLAVLTLLACTAALGADPSRDVDDYVVLGIDGARLGNEAFISAGNVGANDADAVVQLGKHAFMADGTQLVGDQARVLTGSSVCDLFTNTLGSSPSQIAIRCSGPTPFSPLPVILPLPSLPVFSPGGTPVEVLSRQSLTLPAGAYGAVRLRKAARLELTGGDYEFASLDVAQVAKVIVDGPAIINVQGNLRIGDASVFGPVSDAFVVTVNVGGLLIRFGRNATAAIDLFAPNAMIRFGKSFFGRGRFLAKLIGSDKRPMFAQNTLTTVTSTSSTTAAPTTSTASTSSTSSTAAQSTSTTTSSSSSSSTLGGSTSTTTTTTEPAPTSTTTSSNATSTTAMSSTTTSSTPTSSTTTLASTTSTIPPGNFCTMSPGSVGNPGGFANGPSGVITLHPSVLPVTVGAPGDLALTVKDQTSLICFLPTGGTAAALCTGLSACGGDMVIDACSTPPILDFNPSGNGSSGGQGGGTLTGHTIVAKLAVALSAIGATPPGLGSFVLPTRLCTTRGTFATNPAIANGVLTVADLLVMADQALRDPSAFTGPPITRSDIDTALSAINLGFDQCGTVVPCP